MLANWSPSRTPTSGRPLLLAWRALDSAVARPSLFGTEATMTVQPSLFAGHWVRPPAPVVVPVVVPLVVVKVGTVVVGNVGTLVDCGGGPTGAGGFPVVFRAVG